MNDNKKIKHWAKTLDETGYLDEVEDSWTLKETKGKEKAKIVVESKKGKEKDPQKPTDTLRGLSDQFVSSEEIASRLPTPPVEGKAPLKTTDPVPPDDTAIRSLMKEKYAVGDYSGALDLAEQLLESNPENNEASLCRLKCRKTLMQMYESRIGSFSRVPERMITEEEIIWRNLDPVAGFIVASVDGVVTFEDIIDISTLSRFETCRVLNLLLQDGIIK